MNEETVQFQETASGYDRIWHKDFVLINLITLAHATSFQFLLPTLPIYLKSMGGQDTDIGLILGIYSISALVSRILAGRALDLWGRKRPLVIGTFLFFLAALLYNATNTVPSILLLRVFHGVGMGIVGTACGVLVADVAPPHRRAEAMGYFGLTSSVPMALGSGIGLWLIEAQGFPWSGFALLFVVCSAVAAFEVLFSLFVRETRPGLRERQPNAGKSSFGSLFSRQAMPLTVTMGFVAVAMGGMLSFVPIYLTTENAGNVSIFFFTFAIVMGISRPSAGLLADRIDRRLVVIPLILFCAIGAGILTLAPSMPVVLASAIIFGIGFGSAQPTMMALVVDMVKPQERGAAVATFQSSFDVGIGLGSIILGVVAQAAGYRAVFPVASFAAVLGLLYFLVYQRSLSKATGNRGLR